MNRPDMDELRRRELFHEFAATMLAARRHEERKARRRARVRDCAHFWLSPWQVAGHPGEVQS